MRKRGKEISSRADRKQFGTWSAREHFLVMRLLTSSSGIVHRPDDQPHDGTEKTAATIDRKQYSIGGTWFSLSLWEVNGGKGGGWPPGGNLAPGRLAPATPQALSDGNVA